MTLDLETLTYEMLVRKMVWTANTNDGQHDGAGGERTQDERTPVETNAGEKGRKRGGDEGRR